MPLKICQKVVSLDLRIALSAVILPSIKYKLPSPFAVIQPQTKILPSPCFAVAVTFRVSNSEFGFLHAYHFPSFLKILNFVSSENMNIPKFGWLINISFCKT